MRITLIGCGNMGLIYARAFLKYNIVRQEELLLVEKNADRVKELEKMNLGKVVTPGDPVISDSELILIAVKPQDFPELAPLVRAHLKPHNVVLSIMAGIPLSYLAQHLQHETLVRAMPNSPAGVGMGVTALIARQGVTAEQQRKAENVLATTGRTVYVEDESLLDAVTALSGSGPAYFFYIVKNMVEAGKAMGIEEGIAEMLVKQTMLGAFHLINQADKSLDELIAAVSSRGGTTEAAFNVFKDTSLGENLQKAIFRAEERARELSKT